MPVTLRFEGGGIDLPAFNIVKQFPCNRSVTAVAFTVDYAYFSTSDEVVADMLFVAQFPELDDYILPLGVSSQDTVQMQTTWDSLKTIYKLHVPVTMNFLKVNFFCINTTVADYNTKSLNQLINEGAALVPLVGTQVTNFHAMVTLILK